MISASRVTIMSFTLEILMTFFFVTLALISHSLSLSQLMGMQTVCTHICMFLPVAPLLFITFLLETNRIPFDLCEAESELIAGYTTEYGGFFFVLFYLGEYFHLLSFCTFFNIALFGGFV